MSSVYTDGKILISPTLLVMRILFYGTTMMILSNRSLKCRVNRRFLTDGYIFSIRFTSPNVHTTDRPEPYTADRPEGTGRHACPQAILKFVRRIQRYLSSFDVASAAMVTCHTDKFIPLTLLLAQLYIAVTRSV